MQVEAFFKDIDRNWPGARTKPSLRVIGSVALMLQTDYDRGTKDSDILETTDLDADLRNKLTVIAGAGSALAGRHRLYLEIVPSGLPFLPHVPAFRSLDSFNSELRNFDVQALDVVDVVVSKLKRLHASDREDIAAMVERGFVSHAALVQRFRLAVDSYADGAGGADLPRIVNNLHRVERDDLLVEPTDIELPGWVV